MRVTNFLIDFASLGGLSAESWQLSAKYLCYTVCMEITITLPDGLAGRVAAWAQLTQQDLPKVVETALDVALPPLLSDMPAVETLSDVELLALTQVRMDDKQGDRLAQLQAQQREGDLTATEKQDLLYLMHQYNELWVRQSQALALAVQRDLMPPLAS